MKRNLRTIRTTKNNVINSRVVVRSFDRMDDASGAPAVLECDGFVFAFDMLGEMKLRLIGGSGSRTASKVARDVCAHAYLTLLETRVELAWREKNIRMYDEYEKQRSHGHSNAQLDPLGLLDTANPSHAD